MIMAQEQAILNGKVAFDQIVQLVRDASDQGWRIDQTERGLFSGLLELGRQLLEAFVAGQNNGNMGEDFEYEGRTLQRLEDLHQRRYVSVFGVLGIDRYAYGTRETQKLEVIPLDARLGLPKDEYSYLLQEWDQSHCVQNAYEQSRSSVERILGLRQSVRALEHMNGHMARSVEGFRQQQPAPPPEEEGSIVVLTADGKGVIMRRNDEEPASVRLPRRSSTPAPTTCWRSRTTRRAWPKRRSG
jgi:hypothetical protein